MRYILWAVALLGACDATIEYCRSSHKKAEIDIFNATQVEYDIIKHFASLSFITEQHAFLLKNGLTTCYL